MTAQYIIGLGNGGAFIKLHHRFFITYTSLVCLTVQLLPSTGRYIQPHPTHTHTPSHTHPHTVTHPTPHTHTPSHTPPHTHTHTHTHCHTAMEDLHTLTPFLHILELSGRNVQSGDVSSHHLSPSLQTLQHIPRLREIHHDHGGGVLDGGSRQHVGEELAVPDHTVQDPD